MKLLLSAVLAATVAMPAAATTLRITIENNGAAVGGGTGGFALTPLYTGFHDGGFDAFDVGSVASAGVEQVAEVGQFGTVAGERTAAVDGSQGAAFFGGPNATGAAADGTPTGRPIFGGESVTRDIDIDVASQRFFTFLSMVIPTNDLFIGTDEAIELFAADGTYNGDQTISIFGDGIYDAGTEVNDSTFGVAFADGQAGGAGPTELDAFGNPVGISAGFGELAQYVGLTTVPGFEIDPGFDLTSISGADFAVATISIELVPSPVPLPAGGLMLLSALGAGGFAARRKAKKASA